MQTTKLTRAGVLALVLALAFAAIWEISLRRSGFDATFNDDKILWAEKRRQVYQSIDRATVFIGSSRIKFDLDIPEWENLTGEEAVQLSLVGTSPVKLLQDLADDEKFRGKVVVDVTEVLFFSQFPPFHKSAVEAISYYKKQSPSEKLSARINTGLESGIVFLEERRFALNVLLNDLSLPNRSGVFSFPAFPKGFEWTTKDRQTYMSEMFLSDSNDIKRQTDIWSMLILGNPAPPVSGEELEKIFTELAEAVRSIRSRGGDVIFVRTPSSGPMVEAEHKAYPRTDYWDRLLQLTQSKGVHYLDNPVTAALICPEWSHLSPADAIIYTRELVNELRQTGWFPSKGNTP